MRLLRPLDVKKLSERQNILAVGAPGVRAAVSVDPALKNFCDRRIKLVNLSPDCRRLSAGKDRGQLFG